MTKGLWDLNSLTRDGTRATTVKVPVLTTESPGNSTHYCLKTKPSVGGGGHTQMSVTLQADSHTSFWWYSLSVTHFCTYHRINRTKLTFDSVQLLSHDHHKKWKPQCGTRSFVLFKYNSVFSKTVRKKSRGRKKGKAYMRGRSPMPFAHT